MVISQLDGSLDTQPAFVASYYDLLAKDAFGNFRTLLEDVTLHPAQGQYLDMIGNQRTYVSSGQLNAPNENYAREIMQLFSIGLTKLNPDGSPILDANPASETFGLPVATYNQDVVVSMARVFTGWNYNQAGTTSSPRAPISSDP